MPVLQFTHSTFCILLSTLITTTTFQLACIYTTTSNAECTPLTAFNAWINACCCASRCGLVVKALQTTLTRCLSKIPQLSCILQPQCVILNYVIVFYFFFFFKRSRQKITIKMYYISMQISKGHNSAYSSTFLTGKQGLYLHTGSW